MFLKIKCVFHFQVCVFFSSADINRAVELLDKLQRTGEVPPQKLQALQRVLQSEFCNAVREVCFLLNTYSANAFVKGGKVICWQGGKVICLHFKISFHKF